MMQKCYLLQRLRAKLINVAMTIVQKEISKVIKNHSKANLNSVAQEGNVIEIAQTYNRPIVDTKPRKSGVGVLVKE